MESSSKDIIFQAVSSATTGTKEEMRRALIVGIDDYEEAPLSGCVNDAQRMLEVFSKHHDGSPNFGCKGLLAPKKQEHSQVTRAILRERLEELFGKNADVALFYFSGHGTENNLGGYLVTQDAKRYDEGVSMTNVLTLANRSKINEVIIILDCCHSGALGQLPSIENDSAVLREGVSVLTSSRSTQPSLEVGGAGIFTSYICDALEGGAADVCGDVTIAAVYAYVDRALGAWDQRPLFKSHVSRLISLRKCDHVIDDNILRMLPEYFPDQNTELSLDPSFEPTADPKDEKNEKIFAHLQELRSVWMVVPVGASHMFDAAMLSKPCRLTPLGKHYWHLANSGQI